MTQKTTTKADIWKFGFGQVQMAHICCNEGYLLTFRRVTEPRAVGETEELTPDELTERIANAELIFEFANDESIDALIASLQDVRSLVIESAEDAPE